MAGLRIEVSRKRAVTEEEALDDDWDMIPNLTALAKTRLFIEELEIHRNQLERLISRHLGIPSSGFVLLGQEQWIWGSFNICLPIDIKRNYRSSIIPSQAILRFPLPFRCGEEYSPGSVEKKLSCRTWLQGDVLSPFYSHRRIDDLSKYGYLLLEYVVTGDPLSITWQQHRQDEVRRNNLYRGISRILLDLAAVPLPRIGSWTMDDRGVISLTNRPLVDLTMLWNRHEIPTGIPLDMTYTSGDSFAQDMLGYQANRLRYQLNSILGRPDGVFQLSALTALRTLLPNFWNSTSRRGPFTLSMPDLHQSNMFVDDDWNIVGVINLMFAPVQPQQMVGVPLWLSDKSVDELEGPALSEYQSLYDSFVSILHEEESDRSRGHAFSQRLREDWQTGRMWYNAALRSSNGFPLIFEQNLQPCYFAKFEPDVEGSALMRLWGEDCEEFIAAKLRDKVEYERRVRAIFAVARAALDDKKTSD